MRDCVLRSVEDDWSASPFGVTDTSRPHRVKVDQMYGSRDCMHGHIGFGDLGNWYDFPVLLLAVSGV